MSPVLGVIQSSFEISNVDPQNSKLDFGSKTDISFGVEAEYVLPFNKNKWSVFIEPSISKYSGTSTYHYMQLSVQYTEELQAKSSFINVPVGGRHYFFINDKSQIFVDLAYVYIISKTDDIRTHDSNNLVLDKFLKTGSSIAAGIGFKYSSASVEARYYESQDLDDYILRQSTFSKFAILIKYRIF